MKLELSDTQKVLVDAAAKLFADESPPGRVRAAEAAGGLDRRLWDKAAALGLTTMREDGATLLDAALVVEQAGRQLVSAPLVEAMVSGLLLKRLGLAPRGLASLAVAPARTGELSVPWGRAVDTILTLDRDRLIELPSRAARGGPLCAVVDSRADGTVVARGDHVARVYAEAVEEWRLLTAAQLAGVGRRALELAADYSRERIQFGRSIGAFQGVAHPLADSLADVEGAQLLVQRAIWAISNAREEAAGCSALAWWWAADAARRATVRAVRTFGGYGVSLETDIQLYFRRARTLALAGDAAAALDDAAARLFDGHSVPLPPPGECELDFAFGPEADAYAATLRGFVEANLTPDVQAVVHHSTSGHHPGFHRKLAQAGHAFPELSLDGAAPRRSRYEMMAAAEIWEAMGWTRVPVIVTEMVAKMAQRWSTPDARDEILRRIIDGEALGCLGFTEPGAGSDVFACAFGATREGDEWVLNGQKIFTTNAHNADYILLLTRTSRSERKHDGLTMFIMPLRLPGVDIHPVYTLQDERTNIVYFQDVRVADRYRLGEVGDGARVMASALELEHGGIDYHFTQRAMVAHALAWARRQPQGGGAPPIAETPARHALARAHARLFISEALCRRAVWATTEGRPNAAWGPMSKLFTTEALLADAGAIVDLAAPLSAVRGVDPDIDAVECAARRAIGMTIYGGTSEVHRSIIAESALGMPRSRS